MMLADEANSFFNKIEFDPNGDALGEACRMYPGRRGCVCEHRPTGVLWPPGHRRRGH